MAPVLEIGRSLQEARAARGLTLDAVERETKIRARYLGALEAERFAELPGDAYARGFLRTYADHLGLDGQEVLAAYRAREGPVDEAQPVAPRPQRPYRPRRLGPAIAGLAVAVALVVSSLVAWRLGGEPAPAARPQQPAAAPPVAAGPTSVVLTATAPTPLRVRLGGPGGRVVWTGTLRPDRKLRLGLARPLWVRAAKPDRLRLDLGGTVRRLPAGSAAAIVARSGVRTQ